MGLYMLQFSYTVEAWNALAKNPQDRSGLVAELAAKMGGRMISIYYCFGEYDGVVIYEAPDDIAASATVFAGVSPGHIKASKTTKLLSVDDTLAALRKAGAVTYPGPSGA
ncbi:MAG: GYD domain-containing protein [Thermomicrobiales bacterium]